MADNQIVTNIVATSDFSNLIADVNKVANSLATLQQTISTTNKQLQAQVAVMNRSFADTIRSTGQFSKHFITLTSDVETFGKNLDGGRLKLRDYFRVYQDHVRTSGGLIRDLAKQQIQLQNAIVQPLGRNAQGLMQFNVHVPRGLDTIKNKTAIARQELQIMNKVIQDGGIQLINWGKNTQWAGRQLTVGLTLPLAAFGKAAADAFKQADQELTRLTKVYGDIAGTSKKELASIRKEVAQTAKELSAAMGVNFSETIGLAADIAATGKQGNELLSSIKETTRLAVLGEVDRQEAMKATLAIQSAFKQNTDQLAESINFLNAVENQTSTTLNDLVEAIPKAGPVIKGLGGDVQDLALYLTAMREGGINASEGANALKSALASLINPTDVAVRKFEGFGIDLLGIVNKNAGNVTATLFALQGALDKLDPLQKQQAIEQLFGKFQFSRLNALFENLGRQGSQTLQVLDLMKASTAQLGSIADRELAAVTESASGRYKRAVESLRADLAGVGDKFLNIATKLINGLDAVINFLQKLPDPVKNLLTVAGAFTAIVGPVIMLTGVLANFVGYLIKGYGHIKAFLKGGEGFKLLTPQMIAAEKAANLVAASLYSDAKAADILHVSLTRLKNDFLELQRISAQGGISVQPTISTAAGSIVMPGMPYRRVDPTNPFVGGMASAHLNPRDPKNPATLFGLVPSAEYVNMKIGRNPQIMMEENLPNVPGLTTIPTTFRGKSYDVSTGVVAGEAARYQALMATLGMQSKAEVEELKKTIQAGGAISSDFIQTFDDILPITTRLSTNAAKESAAIVAQLRAGKITVEQARAEIIRINAQLEAMLGADVAAYAASKGRTIDLTKVPLIDQPVVDPRTGKPNMRALFREGRMQDVMQAVGRATRTRTMGAPYSIHTTLPPGYNNGGRVKGYIGGGGVYETNGMPVPGPNINADVVPAVLTPGEFVLTRGTVEREGSDAVEALHRGEATIVPVINSHEGGPVPHAHPHDKFLVRAHVTPSSRITAREAVGLLGASSPESLSAFAQYYPEHTVLRKDDTTIRLPQEINNILRDEVGGGVGKDRLLNVFKTFGPEDVFMDWPELTPAQKSAMHAQLIDRISQFPSERRIYDTDLSSMFNESKIAVRQTLLDTERALFDEIFDKRSVTRKIGIGSFDTIAPGKSGRISSGANLSTPKARLAAGTLTEPAFFTGPQKQGKINVLIPGGRKGSFGISSGASLNVKAAYYAASEAFKRGFRRNAGGPIPGRAGGYVRRGRRNYGDYVLDPNTGLVLPSNAVPQRGPTIHGGNFIPLSYLTGGALAREAVPLTGGTQTQNPYMMSALTGRHRMMGFGASILGGTGGSYLGTKLTGGNMLGQMAGFIAGEAAATALMNRYIQLGKSAEGAANKTSLLKLATQAFSRLPGPAQLLTVVLAVGSGLKYINDRIKEHRAIINQAFAPTEDTVDKLKLKYESLNETLKTARERMEALEKTGSSIFSRTTQTGIPGLTLTIQQLKELKEAVVTDFPDLIDIFNKAKPEEVIGKAAQLKAQFVAGGMGAQDAANMIYALVASSNDAALAIQAINDKGFKNIKTGADAAAYSLQVLFDLIEAGNTDQLAASFDQVVNSLRNYEKSLINTKDDQGEIVDRTKALQKTLLLITAESEKNAELSGLQLDAIKRQSPELRSILGTVEDTAGAYAKIQLYVMGITNGLSEMNSAAAQAKLIGITSAISQLESATGPFAPLANAIAAQQKIVDSAGQQAAKVFAKTREQINAEIKLRQKNIAQIKEEADARIKALQEAQEDEDILLKIKEKQLDYQAALAAGDLTGATAAQLEIQGLVRQQQRTMAIRSIQSDAESRIKNLESQIESLQDKLDSAQTKLENAQGVAENAAKKLADLQGLMDRAIEAVLLKMNNPTLTESQASVIIDTKKALAKDFPSIASLLELGPKIPGKEGLVYSNLSPLSTFTKSLLDNAYNKNQEAINVFIKGGSAGFMKLFNTSPESGGGTVAAKPSTYTTQQTGSGTKFLKDGKEITIEEYNKGQLLPTAPPVGTTAYVHPRSELRQRNFSSASNVIKEYQNLGFTNGIVATASGWKYYSNGMVVGPNGEKGRWFDAKYRSYYGGGSIPRFPGGSTDGPIDGAGTGTSDSILARVSNGEYVTKAVSVSDVGVNNMHLINTKGTQGLLEAARNIVNENKAMGGLLDVPSFALGGIFKSPLKKLVEFASKGLGSIKGSVSRAFDNTMNYLGLIDPNTPKVEPGDVFNQIAPGQMARESLADVITNILNNKAILPQVPVNAGQAKLLAKEYRDLAKMYRRSAKKEKKSGRTVADHNAMMEAMGSDPKIIDYNPILKDFKERLDVISPEDFAKPLSPDDKAFWEIVTNPEVGQRSTLGNIRRTPDGDFEVTSSGVPEINIPDLFAPLNAPGNISLYDFYVGKVAENKLIADTYRDLFKLITTDPNTAKRLGLGYAKGGLIGYPMGGLIPYFDKGEFWNKILNQSDGTRRPIFQAKNWEQTANLFSLPEMGRTAYDVFKYGSPQNLVIAKIAGAQTRSSVADNLITASMGIPFGKIPGVNKFMAAAGNKIANFGTWADSKLVNLFSKASIPSVRLPRTGSELTATLSPRPKLEYKFTNIKTNIKVAEKQQESSWSSVLEKEINKMIEARKAARFDLALKDSLIAAKSGGFTPLADFPRTTYKQLYDEWLNLPKTIEEPFTYDFGPNFPNKDYIFKFEKGNLPEDPTSRVSSYLEDIRLGKGKKADMDEKVSGTSHIVSVVDAKTGAKVAHIAYDPISGFVGYRITEPPYQEKGISKWLWDKAASITRIRHSSNLSDPGRKSAEAMGGFMAYDDVYSYGGIQELLSNVLGKKFKAYSDRIKNAKKTKVKLQSVETEAQVRARIAQAERIAVGQRTSTIGWQNDRLLELDPSYRNLRNIRQDVRNWFENPYRTSASFPRASGGIIEPEFMDEYLRIVDLEQQAAKARNTLSDPIKPSMGPSVYTGPDRDAALVAWRNNPERTYNSYPFGHGGYVDYEDNLDLYRLMSVDHNLSASDYVRLGLNPREWSTGPAYINRQAGVMTGISDAIENRATLESKVPNYIVFAGGGYINPSYFSSMTMPSYFTGAKYLYDDTIAQVHKAEAVLPADMNPWNPAAKNPIGGNSLVYVAPVINAAPGMDIEQLTDVATRKIIDVMRKADVQSSAKSGDKLNMNKRYAI